MSCLWEKSGFIRGRPLWSLREEFFYLSLSQVGTKTPPTTSNTLGSSSVQPYLSYYYNCSYGSELPFLLPVLSSSIVQNTIYYYLAEMYINLKQRVFGKAFSTVVVQNGYGKMSKMYEKKVIRIDCIILLLWDESYLNPDKERPIKWTPFHFLSKFNLPWATKRLLKGASLSQGLVMLEVLFCQKESGFEEPSLTCMWHAKNLMLAASPRYLRLDFPNGIWLHPYWWWAWITSKLETHFAPRGIATNEEIFWRRKRALQESSKWVMEQLRPSIR